MKLCILQKFQTDFCLNYLILVYVSNFSVCPKGQYQWKESTECGQQCGHCNGNICNINKGNCQSGCEQGWTGKNCTGTSD